MKISFLLLTITALQVSASLYSQDSKFNFKLRGETVEEAISVIENNSQYKFLYRNELVDVNKRVNLNVRNADIQSVLTELFGENDIVYRIFDDNLIVLTNTNGVSDQELAVSGKVSDGEGNPMPGVNIVEKGTTNGVVTNLDGDFTITVSSPNAILSFSFVGYLTEDIEVGGQSTINLTLVEDIKSLEEVVVIGYGSQKKKDITSAIAVVETEELQKLPVSSVTSALQGLTAGVEVQGNQGRPGEAPTVRIRGASSVNNTDPLYVIDGVPTSSAFVNTADIESMQVLKDAASSAIYGSRGANGVIIITTKKGKTGAPKVSYRGYYGIEKAWKTLDLLNTKQWADLVVENNTAGGTTPPPLALEISGNPNGPWANWDGTETDWQSEIFRTGAIYENNFDVSGGTQNGNYYFSANQYEQEGIILKTPYKRYSLRMNSNWHTNKFKFGENITFVYSQNRGEGTNGGRSVIEEAIKITPNIDVKNPDVQGGYSGYDATLVGHDASNPVGSLVRQRNMNYNKRFLGNVYGEYEIIKDLQFRTTFGVTSTEYQNRNLTLATNMFPKNFANTSLSESANWSYNWVWENMMTLHKVFGDNDLTVMAAYTSEYSKTHGMTAMGNTIQTETNDILSKTEEGFTVGGSERVISRVSYLGRIMYTYKGKYMVTANVRRDGSSKFGDGNKWGTFPSASVAWRLSDEAFLSGVSQISNLKLRLSYGVVGNDNPISPYSYISGLSSGRDYVFNDIKYSGVSVTGFNNANLTWETVKQTDIGLDIGLFKGTIEATVDYFDKRTEDMLIGVPLPASSGSSGTINRNLGSILNKGLELSLTVREKIGDLEMQITGNLTSLHNEVEDLNGGNFIPGGTVEFNNQITRTDVGHQIGAFYGYKMLGVFPDQASIDSYTNSEGTVIQPDAEPGDVKFADLDDDGAITADDRDFIGNPIPSLTYGITANFAYKGFDLSLFFQGIQGNDIYAELIAWTEGMHNNFNAGTAALDRWTPTNTNASIPRAVRNDPNGNIQKGSDRYIKDGSYLRLKNASLGYTLPKSVVNAMHISNLRLYFTGRNLLTVTDYPFYDPEIGSGALGVGGSANTSRGIDNGYYPQSRTLIMGIQIDF